MQLILRPATGADADAIGSVHYQAWMETYTRSDPSRFSRRQKPGQKCGPFPVPRL